MIVNLRKRLLLLSLSLSLSSFCYQNKCDGRVGKNEAILSQMFLFVSGIRVDVFLMRVDFRVKHPLLTNCYTVPKKLFSVFIL